MRAAALVAAVLLAACSTTPPAAPPPIVDCRQPHAGDVPPPPAADEWVEAPGRLSERAALWVLEALGVGARERALRMREHECEDELRRRGDIR